MSNNKTSEDSWDGIISKYLKAEILEYELEKVICIGLNLSGKDMELEVEYNGEKYIFNLNVTNKNFLKDNGIAAPKNVIGKALTLKKVLAVNPQTQKDVPSLRITKIE